MTNHEIRITGEESRARRLAQRTLQVIGRWSLAVLLVSCASDGKKPKSSYTDMKLGQRIVMQTKDPFSIKSQYQKEMYHASRPVKTSDFKAGEYHGKKGFSGSKEKYRAGSFSQSDKASRAGERTFPGADDRSKIGDSSFKTTQNRNEGRMSTQDVKSAPMVDGKFNTDGNPAALRGTQNVKAPLIIRDEPGYSEDFIKRLLNKS